jgi:hypothetical protein
MGLDDSLLSDDLMSYVTTEATVQTSGSSTPGDKSAADIKNTSLARMKIRHVVWCSSNRPIHEMDTNMPNWMSNSYTTVKPPYKDYPL